MKSICADGFQFFELPSGETSRQVITLTNNGAADVVLADFQINQSGNQFFGYYQLGDSLGQVNGPQVEEGFPEQITLGQLEVLSLIVEYRSSGQALDHSIDIRRLN